MHRRRGAGRERGAVILLVSLIMTVLLMVVAFVIDLGTTRATKRDAQAIADLAALDAGYFLSGSSPSGLGVAQPRNACIAAIESAKRNVPGFLAELEPADIEAKCAGLPEVLEDCGLEDQFEIPLVDGDRSMTIRYPVFAEEIDTDRFALGGARDGLDACERLSVSLTKTSGTSFASIMGVGELSTGAGAVVRGTTVIDDEIPPAVLLLDRTNCNVFGNSSSGAGNLGVVVEAFGETPGLIHADSNATTNCTGTSANAYGIYGTSLSGGDPSIRVADGAVPTDGRPQRLGAIRSAATNGKGAAEFPGGLSVAPTFGGVVSRIIVDDKYNSGDNPAIWDFHREAAARLRRVGKPEGHTTVDCLGLNAANLLVLRSAPLSVKQLYVDCNPNFSVDFSGFTSVEFAGALSVGNNNTITLPDATTVTVKGALNISGEMRLERVKDFTVGGGITVSNNSRLAVNSPTADNCDASKGASLDAAGEPVAPEWPYWTKMAVFGGSTSKPAFDVSGPVALCQTSVYLGGTTVNAEYEIQQTTTGSSCAWKPCPLVTGNTVTGARFAISGRVHWTAPNQYAVAVEELEEGEDGTRPKVGLEDLALWTEGSGTSEIKSGGELIGQGVFYGPNANFSMSSPATGAPVDSQFVARRAWLNQGTLKVAPNPANSVVIPMSGDYGLIR